MHKLVKTQVRDLKLERQCSKALFPSCSYQCEHEVPGLES